MTGEGPGIFFLLRQGKKEPDQSGSFLLRRAWGSVLIKASCSFVVAFAKVRLGKCVFAGAALIGICFAGASPKSARQQDQNFLFVLGSI